MQEYLQHFKVKRVPIPIFPLLILIFVDFVHSGQFLLQPYRLQQKFWADLY